MGFFNRKPKLQDEALSELALMFVSFPSDPTPGAELLDSSRLDLTIESLTLVDDYLDAMRQKQLEDQAFKKLVLRCGSYVGETVRRNSKVKTYHWLDYNEALRINKTIADFGGGIGTAAVLWDGADGLTFPLGKVMKFFENGREDSVKFFAQVMIEK